MTHPLHKSVSPLDAHLGYWLRFVSNHVSQNFRRKLESTGVSVGEWVILRELYRLGSVLPSVIAESIGMTRGAVSRLVDSMEEKGLIEREFSVADRRSHVIGLTQQGKKKVPQLAALADQNDDEFFSHLSVNQKKQLITAMKEIVRINNLKTMPTD